MITSKARRWGFALLSLLSASASGCSPELPVCPRGSYLARHKLLDARDCRPPGGGSVNKLYLPDRTWELEGCGNVHREDVTDESTPYVSPCLLVWSIDAYLGPPATATTEATWHCSPVMKCSSIWTTELELQP